MLTRLSKFINLLMQADLMSTQDLLEVLRVKSSHLSVLAKLACLRTIVCREGDPCLTYQQRKYQIRTHYGI